MNIIKKYLVLHPFLFAWLPILHLYSLNFFEYPPYVLIKPFIVLTSITIAFLFISQRFFHDRFKFAVIFSVSVLMIFIFHSFEEFFERLSFGFLRFRIIAFIYLLIFAGILFSLIRARIDFKRLSYFFNISGIIILLIISTNFIGKLWARNKDITVKPQGLQKEIKNKIRFEDMPDIYYIILDSYPEKDVLSHVTGFDNFEFIDYLKSEGFFVTKKNRCNYTFTKFSMASTLNMEFLPVKEIESGVFELKKGIKFNKGIEGNKVVSIFRSMGYRYIDLSIWNKRYYDIDFTGSLLFMTIIRAPGIGNFIAGLLLRDYVMDTLDILQRPIDSNEPFFVYCHVMIPHFPAMFDENGKTPSIIKPDKKTLYLDQLKYTNKRMKKVIDSIIINSKRTPIIIIQGDHGADSLTEDKKKSMKLRKSILNAAYLPGLKENIFYNGMTSINTFRIIFNRYFAIDLKPLPDVTYYQDYEKGRLYLYSPD